MPDYPGIDPKAVGRRIREARERKSLSQPELGGLIGKQGHQVWRYEDGRNVPGSDVIVPLAEHLGVSPAWLLYGREAAPATAAAEGDDSVRTALVELMNEWDPEVYGPPPNEEEQLWVNTQLDFRADRDAGLAVTPRLVRGRILERRAQQRGKAVERPAIAVESRPDVIRPSRDKKPRRR